MPFRLALGLLNLPLFPFAWQIRIGSSTSNVVQSKSQSRSPPNARRTSTDSSASNVSATVFPEETAIPGYSKSPSTTRWGVPEVSISPSIRYSKYANPGARLTNSNSIWPGLFSITCTYGASCPSRPGTILVLFSSFVLGKVYAWAIFRLIGTKLKSIEKMVRAASDRMVTRSNDVNDIGLQNI